MIDLEPLQSSHVHIGSIAFSNFQWIPSFQILTCLNFFKRTFFLLIISIKYLSFWSLAKHAEFVMSGWSEKGGKKAQIHGRVSWRVLWRMGWKSLSKVLLSQKVLTSTVFCFDLVYWSKCINYSLHCVSIC